MGTNIKENVTNVSNLNIDDEKLLQDDNLKEGESVSISDSELIPLLLEEGFSQEELSQAGFYSRYRNGVNKVVKVKNGYDVYLSKSTLELARKGGAAAISKVLATLIGSGFSYVISPLIYQILIRSIPNVKGGMIFRARLKKVYMGQYEGWVEQFVIDSYSYQQDGGKYGKMQCL